MLKIRESGFTLIELLVVIAIIALLMGILMPALSAVRKQAWGVTCQSNLRSVGLAFNLFAQDNNYKIPRGGGGEDSRRWHFLLLEYLARSKEEGADYQDVKVYDCPAYPDKDQTVCFVINAFDPDPEVERDTSEFTSIDTLRARSSTIYLADNEDGLWRPIIKNRGVDWGSTDVSYETHLPGTIISNAELVGAVGRSNAISTTAAAAWRTHAIVTVIMPSSLTGMWTMCPRKKASRRTGVRRCASGEQWEGRIVVCSQKTGPVFMRG